MRLEDYVWLKDNHKFMYASQYLSKEDRQKIYQIYNAITGENKKPNGCGKCMNNTIKRIRFEYEKYQQHYED